MSATLTTPSRRTAHPTVRPATRRRGRMRHGERPNWVGALIAFLWLAVVLVPIYWIVITSLKSQSNYFATNPLLLVGVDPIMIKHDQISSRCATAVISGDGKGRTRQAWHRICSTFRA